MVPPQADDEPRMQIVPTRWVGNNRYSETSLPSDFLTRTAWSSEAICPKINKTKAKTNLRTVAKGDTSQPSPRKTLTLLLKQVRLGEK